MVDRKVTNVLNLWHNSVASKNVKIAERESVFFDFTISYKARSVRISC